MSQQSLLAWLALLRLPGVGARSLAPLLLAGHEPQQLLRRAPSHLPAELQNALRQADWAQAEQDALWLQDSGNQLLCLTDANYPELLRELADPPVALFLRGDAGLLHSPQLAVVGSRNASRGGLENAHQFAQFLAGAGVTITSGLALGIDSEAHRGALHSGTTIAVLGTGLDRVYPARNRDLAHQIAEQGLLVSEFVPGTPPLRQNFPRRNRLIAALSLGTLVIEAALKSGSLITARLAGELGREVFAIPGSIHNPLARGCHRLIREGAKLVESGEHVVEELLAQWPLPLQPGGMPVQDDPPAEALEDDHQTLLEQMGYDPVSTDQLVERSHFSAAEISSMLLLLEMQGHVSSEAGGLFTRLGKLHG